MSSVTNDEIVAEVDTIVRKILWIGMNLPADRFFPALGCAFIATYLASAGEPKREKLLSTVAGAYDMMAPLAARMAVDPAQSEKEGDL